jgi:Ala-tRNA(Pro) deacylase
MSIARRLQWYLDKSGLPYDVIPHSHTATSLDTARAAHVRPDSLAKPVLLEDELGYVLAIVPASHRLDLRSLSEQMNRDLELATEREIADLFPDCELGALPPVGEPYRVPTVYDESLSAASTIYFEAGDHEDVVRMQAGDFVQLLHDARHGRFSSEI